MHFQIVLIHVVHLLRRFECRGVDDSCRNFTYIPAKPQPRHIDYIYTQGRIQDFLKGGSESGVDIEGGTNPSIVSLKLGGAAPQKLWGI